MRRARRSTWAEARPLYCYWVAIVSRKSEEQGINAVKAVASRVEKDVKTSAYRKDRDFYARLSQSADNKKIITLHDVDGIPGCRSTV